MPCARPAWHESWKVTRPSIGVLELESAVGERRRDELRVVLDLELVLLAALGREVGVELLPHQRRTPGTT